MAQNIDASSFINAFVNQIMYQYCLGNNKPAAGTSYVDAVVDTAKKSFTGRMSKLDYLLFIVPMLVISYLLSLPSFILPILSILSIISLAFILPSFACTARRLHDLNMTGWLSLLMIIPIINILLAVYLCITDGQKEANQFGAPPAE